MRLEGVCSPSDASGTHKTGFLGSNLGISDESDDRWGQFVREHALGVVNYRGFDAGDATFHAGWTLHGALPNESGKMRAVMTVIYYPDGTRIVPKFRDKVQRNDVKWIPGNRSRGSGGRRPQFPALRAIRIATRSRA